MMDAQDSQTTYRAIRRQAASFIAAACPLLAHLAIWPDQFGNWLQALEVASARLEAAGQPGGLELFRVAERTSSGPFWLWFGVVDCEGFDVAPSEHPNKLWPSYAQAVAACFGYAERTGWTP